MKTRGVVIFKELCGKWKASLWLTDVKRNPDSTIKSGWVANGCWNYERRGNEELAKDSNVIVNRWPIEDYKEVNVYEDWVEVKGAGWECYNKVMQRAQAIMDNDMTYDYKFKSKEELQRIEDRKKELESLWNDDIAF
jgi:hypothetical protein